MRAAGVPGRGEKGKTWRKVRPAASTIDSVLSREAPSITICSMIGYDWAATDRSVSEIVASLLYATVMIETFIV